MAGILSLRATAVVIRRERVLLVQGHNHDAYMMPGARIGPDEHHSAAAARGLFEQTGLSTMNVFRLFDWESATTRHCVFRIEADGEAQIKNETASFMWWDPQAKLRLFPHVNAILIRLAVYE